MKGEPHHQFPQPTRPILSYDIEPNPLFSEERNSQEFQYPEALKLPKPSDCSSSFPLPKYTSEQIDDSSKEFLEERVRLSPSTGKTPKDKREVVDELLLVLIECMEELNTRSREALLKKFFAEIEKEESLERFVIERLRQSKVKAISEMCEKVAENMKIQGDIEKDDDDGDDLVATRSIHESVEKLSQKLERFKVRTFEGGEVVIEEETDAK